MIISRAFVGSSPRGRGKPTADAAGAGELGLIPARAGKTGRPRALAYASAAHPRAGGENSRDARVRSSSFGSSPRGRGKRLNSRAAQPHRRLIPARAGKTLRIRAASALRWAHPRAGGENEVRDVCERAARWLIPARAGKTGLRGFRGLRGGAHPRAGGENCIEGVAAVQLRGSSPRGRGKLAAAVAVREPVGLIPARAGKTAYYPDNPPAERAHPRAGGENAWQRLDRTHPGWLIPARAGKTPPHP